MKREALNRWSSAALELASVRSTFPAPIHVLMTESISLVRFCRDHWEPIPSGEMARPGLCDAPDPLPPTIADEILELEEALHGAQAEYLLTIPPIHAGLRSRAELVLAELVAALEWLLDDGQRESCDDQLTQLREEHGPRSTSADALSAKLSDYATLASQVRPRLAALGSFDMAIIDDAHHLARELRQICRNVSLSERTAVALDMRNRVATLLVDRMTLVRNSAAVVFRSHPAVACLALSTFELRQKVSSRRPAADQETSSSIWRTQGERPVQ